MRIRDSVGVFPLEISFVSQIGSSPCRGKRKDDETDDWSSGQQTPTELLLEKKIGRTKRSHLQKGDALNFCG